MNLRRSILLWALLSSSVSACASTQSLTNIRPVPVTVSQQEGAALWSEAEAVLHKRCTVCHGCYDAPCQLKLDAFAGSQRGASKAPVYAPARLLAAAPTRLFIDATSVAGWRDKGFYPVLPEGGQRDPYGSVLMRMLGQKRAHPLPDGQGVSTELFDLGINRKAVCPNHEEMDDFEQEHPHWGMPYALPPLAPREEAALVAWIAAGMPGPTTVQESSAARAEIDRWEAFLNAADTKHKLVARYIYEHLFFASIYLRGIDDTVFYRMVRSSTPPGQAVREIPTRRPYESPKGDVYYRIVRRPELRLDKRQMPYALDPDRLSHFQELFFGTDWDPGQLPSYKADVASNPFKAFAAIPVRARYRFMLEEAEYTLMGFIKGPVCHGQTALNVIQDRFWVTFVNPEAPWLAEEAKFLASQTHNLAMPAEDGSTSLMLSWLSFASDQRDYLREKARFVRAQVQAGTPIDLTALWDGDGHNENATLTVFRHFDSATVEKGLIGAQPKTAWVIGYALLERIHYLLVAGFDVFGNVGHQLSTRMYMDFLRMEAEHNFLLLLPQARRRALVNYWYRDVDADVKEEVYGELTAVPFEPSMPFKTDTPEVELLNMWWERFAPVNDQHSSLSQLSQPKVRVAMERLSAVWGTAASLMPETSFVQVFADSGPPSYVTVTRDSAHTNVAHLFNERQRRRPGEDRLTVTHGFLGSYPNALFRVPEAELPAFVDAIAAMRQRKDYQALRAKYGVLRNSPAFWAHSDAIHHAHAELDPLGHGLFDFNRLDAL